MKHFACVLLVLAAPAVAAEPVTLADQQAQLTQATARLNRAIGTGARRQQFASSRRIHADLDQRVFGTWLAAIAPNGLRATATGTSVQGALINRQRPLLGEFSVAIAPAYVIDGEIFWGQDRLDFVQRRLALARQP